MDDDQDQIVIDDFGEVHIEAAPKFNLKEAEAMHHAKEDDEEESSSSEEEEGGD